jgi:hypothetical protein
LRPELRKTKDNSSKSAQRFCRELRKNKMRCGRVPAKFRQVAGFGVGSGIVPVTTVSAVASSSTGGR